MQQRTRSDATLKLVQKARAERAETGYPFWDVLLTQVADASTEAVPDILKEAQYHHDMGRVATTTEFLVTDAKQVEETVEREVTGLVSGEILALNSRIRGSDGATRHLAMLDYRVPLTKSNETLVVQHLATLELSGWLVASGRSFHFLGDTLLAGQDRLTEFLGRALLHAPIVDGRWVAHQLIEGACSLRITTGGAGQVDPFIVRRVEQ